VPIFAVHDGTTVQNVIVADSPDIAEGVTGLQAVEAREGIPGIGWILSEQGWITNDPAPFPSWTWDYETMAYVAPVPMPDGGTYYWDEGEMSWIEFVPQVEDESMVDGDTE
jgi:hypothetical protein